MIAQIDVAKLEPDAFIPTRSNDGDAGLDLYSREEVRIEPGEHSVVGTGIAIAIPHGYAGFIWPRSGLSVMAGIDVLAGVIDRQYRQEVRVVLSLDTVQDGYNVYPGDRVAQLIIQPVELPSVRNVTDLDSWLIKSPRRGGFGSSGK